MSVAENKGPVAFAAAVGRMRPVAFINANGTNRAARRAAKSMKRKGKKPS